MPLSSFAAFQPIAGIATTPQSAQTLAQFCPNLGATIYLPEGVKAIAPSQAYSGSLKDQVVSLWSSQRSLVFCLAAGAVVRLIAPLLTDKAHDPAVVVLDPEGKFVISLCGGHQGGGDRLTQLIAELIGATPILTGASQQFPWPAIDVLGLPYGWNKGSGDWTGLSAAIAKRETVEIIQNAGSPLWQEHLPSNHPFEFPTHSQPSQIPKACLWITAQQHINLDKSPFPQAQWHPRVLWVGIGCIRGTSQTLIAQAIAQTCQQFQLAPNAIAGIATLDLKADEVGLLDYCNLHGYPLRTFTPAQLQAIPVPNPSAVVEQEVGTPSVAEAAALVGAKAQQLLVPKQIFKSEEGAEAVTVAIAQAEQEYIGRTGKLALIGIGPGSLDQITPAAKVGLIAADVIIGYTLYLDLIRPLTRPGQILEVFPITQERQRAQRAIDLAQWGLTVAVISSGDCGIYGMAGLVMERLQQQGWDGKTPQVEVLPGITALQSAASRVGAPLMHDFCAISLSDRLTPLSIIEKRLEAAAIGDFVTAIYNPRSQTRIEPLHLAHRIFCQHRGLQTPVALVRSAYRPEEQIGITTLENLLAEPIDMFTTLIIGNSNTQRLGDWLITPRGYEPQTFGS